MSGLRCCSRSWRSWPVSATRLTGASWRSRRRSSTTAYGAPRVRGRWRRWSPGSLGSSSTNAHTITAVANRSAEFPRCVQGLREGRLSLDQVGVIAERASDGSDEHYAALAEVASVSQLRTAVKLEPRPQPDPRPEAQRVDHQNHRRAIHYLADHAAQARRREIRCGAAVPPGCVDRRVEARSRRRPALPESATAARRVRGVSCGWSRPGGTPTPPADPMGSTPRW